MAAPVLVDAGPLVAFLLAGDQYHDWATTQFARLHDPLFTCEAVISEAMFLVEHFEPAHEKFCAMMETGEIRLAFNLREQLPSVLELIRRYRDVPMSLADACLVRMAELHDRSKVFTLDAHFRAYRKHRRQPRHELLISFWLTTLLITEIIESASTCVRGSWR